MDQRNIKSNLPQDEIEAMKELIRLQKEKIIVIIPCDKGAGMILLDYPVYMRACYEHLAAETNMGDGEVKPYYIKK